MRRRLLRSTLPLLLSVIGCSGGPIATPAPPRPMEPVSAPAPVAVPESLDAELPFDQRILRERLDNGLTYYLLENATPEARADIWLVVDAGSLQEDDSQRGLAHFVEHMAFNGTENFEKQDLVDYLQSIGMRFGPDVNAYTSFDETVYMLRVPTDDDEVVAKAFQILEDWAHGVVFEDEEIDKERGVVVEEWRLGRGARGRLLDKQLPIIFKDSRYAERLPIGKKEILETAPYDELRRFYRDWYRPDLMAVIAVGDFEAEAIEELIQKHFAGLENPASPRPRESASVPDHAEALYSVVTDPELTFTSVDILHKFDKRPQHRVGDYRRQLGEQLYHGMLNARLSEIRRRADPPFVEAFSSSDGFVRVGEMSTQRAIVEEGKTLTGLEALLAEVERVDRHGFTATELERAKSNLLRSYERAYDEREKRLSGSYVDELRRNFLEDEPVPGIELEVALARRFVPELTLEEINELAGERISEANRVVLLSGPEKPEAPLPEAEALAQVFTAVESTELGPWVDEVRDEPLLAEAPTPGPVVEESVVESIGVTEWRLANGVRVILKPTDFRNDQVLLRGFSPGGHSLVEDDQFLSASFATAILSEGGLGEFSQIELQKALSGKAARASTYISELEEGVSADASPQDLETMFQLLYLGITSPRADPQAFESFKTLVRTVVENRQADPGNVFEDEVTRALYQDHPRRQPLSSEMLAGIDLDKAAAVYRDRFRDAGDFTFVVVGTFEVDAIRPLVETYLGGLPAGGREETWRDVGVETPDGVTRIEVRRGLEPKSRVRILFGGPAEWSREGTHDINSLATALRMKFFDVLREDLGAVYGVRVGGGLTTRPKERYSFTIEFGCAPESVDRLVAAVFDELTKLREEGIEESYVTKVREGQIRKRETDLKENRFWLSVLETYYDLGLDPELILDHETLVERVTAENLKASAERYLDPEEYFQAVLYPEAEGESEAP